QRFRADAPRRRGRRFGGWRLRRQRSAAHPAVVAAGAYGWRRAGVAAGRCRGCRRAGGGGMRRPLLLLLYAAALSCAEWRLEATSAQAGSLRLPTDALSAAGSLRIGIARLNADEHETWIELGLVAADGRRFALASPIHLAGDDQRAT